jgi:hypothetical protein
MKKYLLAIAILAMTQLSGCLESTASSDAIQAQMQEKSMREATAETGMPAIKNFRERKLLKMIYELRDKEDLTTYTYLVAQATGKLELMCKSVGYGLDDSTGYTNPMRIHESGTNMGYAIMPQPEPNGLFTPATSNMSWVVCVDDAGAIRPVQVKSDFVVSPFALK